MISIKMNHNIDNNNVDFVMKIEKVINLNRKSLLDVPSTPKKVTPWKSLTAN